MSFILASSAKPEPVRRENARKGSVVNVNPTNIRPQSDSPEIRKYKKKFNSEVLCAALWGKRRGTRGCGGGEAAAGGAGRLCRADVTAVSTSPVRDPWRGSLSRYLQHSPGAASLLEDGKQMTYSCKGFCALE